MPVVMNLWPYQSSFPWTDNRGILTDQARLWLDALYKSLSAGAGGGGGVQIGGDLGGTDTTPIVIGIQGRPVSTTAPTNGEVLTWNSTDGKWEPEPGASGGGTFVTEVPGGAMNGANTSFTLTHAPITGSLTVFLNGVEQMSGTDITVSGTTVTYTVPPKSNDLMVAQYAY